MRIGIVGSGKMGNDVFNLIRNSQGVDKAVLICRKNETSKEINEKIKSKYMKKVSRGQLTAEDADELSKKLFASNMYEDLHDCDIVIESVTEDLCLKQGIVEKIEKMVSETCVIMSNTSSLNIKDIFVNVSMKENCAGFHFFYPVLMWPAVEICFLSDKNNDARKKVESFVEIIDKVPLHLSISSNLLISRILTAMVAYLYSIYVNFQISPSDMDYFVKDQIMAFGIFETIDASGFTIIKSCLNNFNCKQHENIMSSLLSVILSAENAGYNSLKIALNAEGNNCVEKNGKKMRFDKSEAAYCVKKFIADEIDRHSKASGIRREEIVRALRGSIGLQN